MPLHPVQQQQFDDFIRNNVPGGLRCTVCGSHQFGSGDVLAVPTLGAVGANVFSGITAVCIVCARCGQMMLFSARHCGVTPPPKGATADPA